MVDMPIYVSSSVHYYNGIICVDDRRLNQYLLINLANKEYHKIPQSMLYDRVILMYRMGLRFDSRDNDFKIVRYGSGTNMKPIVEIYNLMTNSWRVISSPLPLKHYYQSLKSMFSGGYYF